MRVCTNCGHPPADHANSYGPLSMTGGRCFRHPGCDCEAYTERPVVEACGLGVCAKPDGHEGPCDY